MCRNVLKGWTEIPLMVVALIVLDELKEKNRGNETNLVNYCLLLTEIFLIVLAGIEINVSIRKLDHLNLCGKLLNYFLSTLLILQHKDVRKECP